LRIYAAVDSAQSISFNQLHTNCSGRIGYDKRCRKCHETVGNDAIQKGYEYEPDRYVIVEKEDMEKIRLKSTKVIEIESFVDAASVPPYLFETPYFAGPESEIAAKPYALLRESLRRAGRVGIGRVVLRDREEIVLISPHEETLILYKLRYPGEMRNPRDVPEIGSPQAVDEDQMKLAAYLLDTMSGSFDRLNPVDRYQQALKELIQAKIEGKEVVVSEEIEGPVVDIMTALKQSIEAAKARRSPMLKAAGKTAAEKRQAGTQRGRAGGSKRQKA